MKSGGTDATSDTPDSVDDPAETATTPAKKPAKTAVASTSGSSGRRFGDGASGAGTRKGTGPSKSGGRGGRGGGGRGGRPAPAVRVAAPKPWGMIAATVAVVLFAVSAIGYAVYQSNSNALPEDASEIGDIAEFEYAAGQEHVTTDVDYTESPPVGGPHDIVWADCDGAVYDQQVRSENAIHSMEHGAVWLTYNPDDISDGDLQVLTGYVQSQSYIFLSPYSGLGAPISLQSWNHQLFLDSVDDPRINEFIQTLRQNPEEYPEIGASCSQPAFLVDPVIEGEQSRTPQGGAVVTDAPTTP